MDVRIAVRSLPRDPLGYWHSSRTIVLDDRLTQAQRRCALARQLVHIELEDVDPCVVQALVTRRLVTFEDLTLALLAHEQEHDQAAELGVDLATLRAAYKHAQ